MTHTVDINLDLTEITKVIGAYQTALMSFGREWASAYPDQIGNGVDFLDRLVEESQLPPEIFAKVKAALRGEG